LNRFAGTCLEKVVVVGQRRRAERRAGSAQARGSAPQHDETPDYVVFFMEPSVAQPPLPLQEFLPLQPLSPVLQPPLPLQEFCPLQACFSLVACQMVPEDCPASELLEETPWPVELEETVLAFRRVIVPPSRPVNAAVSTKEPLETFMILYTPSLVGYSRHSLKFSDARGKIATAFVEDLVRLPNHNAVIPKSFGPRETSPRFLHFSSITLL
jgi:hypothetical protein